MPDLPTAGPRLSPSNGAIPWGDQPATWWQVDHFLHGKGSVLSSVEYMLILAMDLPSLHIKLLPKPPYVDLQTVLSTIIAFYMVLLLTKELTSYPEKM